MSSICGKEYIIDKFLPILIDLAKDDNSDVRKNVVIGLKKVFEVAGVDALSVSLSERLDAMTQDPQWRVRQAVFEFFGEIIVQFRGRESTDTKFLPKVLPIFNKFLTNNAASVR